MEVIDGIEGAPYGIGHFSQAVIAGDFVFLSGQIALKPGARREFEGGDARRQTQRILDNIHAILCGLGLSFADLVKTTIYLEDMSDFAAINEVYSQRLGPDSRPARETVAVKQLAFGALVEISAVGYRSGMSTRVQRSGKPEI